MEKRKFDHGVRYLYALLITITIFFSVFFIVQAINNLEFQRITILQEKVFYDFYKTQLDYTFFNNQSCDKVYLEKLGESIDFHGMIIDDLENKFGKSDEKVKSQKKYYSLLELSHFSLLKQLDETCGLDYNFILFFYSNDEGYIDKSKEIGDILNYVKREVPSTMIYSFDFNLDDPLINNLKNKYHIDNSITMILNENLSLNDIHNANELISLLKN